MSRIPLILGGACFGMAAALSLGVAYVASDIIEDRSVAAVEMSLTLNGMDWVDVTADGLQVFLEGEAPDEAENFRAAAQAGAIIDPDRVVNRMTVARAETIAPPRFSLDMLRNGDGIQLIGLVPLAIGDEPVSDAIEDIAEGVEVTNMIETADFPTPDTWVDALDYGLRALTELPRSKVTVYADRVEIQAVSESMAQRAEFVAILERGRPRGVDIVLDISAPRPVITPFTLRFVIDDNGARFETCAADTLEARDQILSAAQDVGAEGLLVCPIGLGVPSPRWADAVDTALHAVQELGGGTVSFSDADVTLIAVEGTDQNEFDRVMGELDAGLPDVFSLHGVLPQPETRDTGGPAQFLAIRDEDGTARLRGRLPEGPVGDSVEAFALALFGQENTDVATRAVPDLPQGWSIRVMVGLRGLAELHDGRLVVEPDSLRLTGNTGVATLSSDLTRLFSEELGAAAEFEIDVTYVEALDPVAAQPTPEECVARIQAIQDEGKIVFEPGSVSLTDEAGAILDRIAEILPDCRHVRMEIAGHTDSQGREEMNLNLSQSRADAVLNGLLAREVLISNLVAQGYGESQPIADNDTDAGRERNRRIEFRLLTTAATGGSPEDDIGDPDAEADADSARAVPTAEFRPIQRPDSVVEAAAAAAEDAETDEEGDDQ